MLGSDSSTALANCATSARRRYLIFIGSASRAGSSSARTAGNRKHVSINNRSFFLSLSLSLSLIGLPMRRGNKRENKPLEGMVKSMQESPCKPPDGESSYSADISQNRYSSFGDKQSRRVYIFTLRLSAH